MLGGRLRRKRKIRMKICFYEEYVNKSHSIIDKLNDYKSLLYAFITAKRFFDFYLSFSTSESFGNPKLLQLAEEIIEKRLKNIAIDNSVIQELCIEIDKNIPDSDDYGDCSDAMDSSIIHYYILKYIIDGKKEYIKGIADFVYDLCDRYAQEKMQITAIDDEKEKIIETSPIITYNINNELELLIRIQTVEDNKLDLDVFINENTKDFLLN